MHVGRKENIGQGWKRYEWNQIWHKNDEVRLSLLIQASF